MIPEYKVLSEPTEHGHKYALLESFEYHSPRYGKKVSAKAGATSDGATGAFDIHSLAWWVHDMLCKRGTFDDGTPCTNWEASSVLSDILKSEGRWARARYWFAMTWAFGCEKCRENGML